MESRTFWAIGTALFAVALIAYVLAA